MGVYTQDTCPKTQYKTDPKSTLLPPSTRCCGWTKACRWYRSTLPQLLGLTPLLRLPRERASCPHFSGSLAPPSRSQASVSELRSCASALAARKAGKAASPGFVFYQEEGAGPPKRVKNLPTVLFVLLAPVDYILSFTESYSQSEFSNTFSIIVYFFHHHSI